MKVNERLLKQLATSLPMVGVHLKEEDRGEGEKKVKDYEDSNQFLFFFFFFF